MKKEPMMPKNTQWSHGSNGQSLIILQISKNQLLPSNTKKTNIKSYDKKNKHGI